MSTHDFDVAVTFAGEDRQFVDEVVTLVKAVGLVVFYDEDAKVEMWGEELSEYFADVYERRARYAVMFVSTHYAAKTWTQHERRSVLLRAMESPTPYVLPVRLDSTQLPGLRSSVGYLDALREGADGVAAAITAKLGASEASNERHFNGRVPRTAAEAATLLGERPQGWEYLAFSYWLSEGVAQRRSAYNDHRVRFALGGAYIPTGELRVYLDGELARMLGVTTVLEDLLLGPAQEMAMGAPGEPGDPDLIEHLASRILLIYDELLAWAYRLRSANCTQPEGREALQALADYAIQPIEALRGFVFNLQAQMDDLHSILERGESVSKQYILEFDIPKFALERFGNASQKLRRMGI